MPDWFTEGKEYDYQVAVSFVVRRVTGQGLLERLRALRTWLEGRPGIKSVQFIRIRQVPSEAVEEDVTSLAQADMDAPPPAA